jgi:hypothetical protein
MRSRVVRVLSVATLTAFAACGDDTGRPATSLDSGGSVSLTVIGTCEVVGALLATLQVDDGAATGTGFLSADPSTAAGVLVSTAYEGPEGELVGAGGTDVFEFDATAAGFATVRPFEKGTAPAETRSIHVDVSPG